LLTLNDVFFTVVERRTTSVMMYRQASGWVGISGEELRARVTALAGVLREWGIAPGERVAILSENRPEWAMADFATLLIGGVVVPIYTTLTAEQSAYILRDSGARTIFVSTETQLQKILDIRDQAQVDRIVVMDPVETAHAHHMHRLLQPTGQPGEIAKVAHAI